MKKQMRATQWIAGLMLAAGVLLVGALATGCTEKEEEFDEKVLVVHSYAPQSKLYVAYHKEQKRALERQGMRPDIRYIYLDCERFTEQEELQQMRLLVDSVTQGWRPDVILVNDDQATYSLLQAEIQLVRSVPVVFAGVHFPNVELLRRYRNVTGIHDEMALVENMKLIKDLFPEHRGVFTLVDSNFLDGKVREQVVQQLAGLQQEPAMRLEQYSMRATNGQAEEALEVMKGVKGKKMYLQLKRDLATERVGLINANPCFTAISEGFDRNEMLLGGYFAPMESQMKQQADIAARILKGTPVASIPLQPSQKQYVLDWNVWRLLGKADDAVPSYVKFVNRPVVLDSPARFYGAWAVAILLFGLMGLIFYVRLKSERRKRQELLAELQNDKEMMELAIRGGGTYAWVVEDDRFIIDTQFWNEVKVAVPATRLNEFVQYLDEPVRYEAMLAFSNLTETANKVMQVRCDFARTGVMRWWEFRFVTQNMGGKVRTMGLLLDIDKKKRYDEDMKRAREIAEKTELKHSFLTNISHEIRTPLNAIVGFTTVLHSEESLEEEEKRMCLDSINDNTAHLLSLVGDILDLSRFESGTMDMELEKCNVRCLMEEIYDGYRKQVSDRLEFKLENIEIDAFVTIDRIRFVQVMNSFLSNASKFTSRGYVKLGCAVDDGMQKIHFYVEDTGVGIKEEEMKIIFSRFYKQDAFSKGTGLGLALSKVIVEKLDGKLEVVSKVGVGSRFIVTLPCWRILSNRELLVEQV